MWRRKGPPHVPVTADRQRLLGGGGHGPGSHALEFPGKLRLDKETYCAVQTIYYPGFTFGELGEPLAMAATLALLLTTPSDSAAFPLTLAGFITLVVMHGSYGVFTHPVNTFWLKDQDLSGLGAGFFGFDPMKRHSPGGYDAADVSKRFRDRWEYSHVLRAVLSASLCSR